jgi:D-cysteine desulfhydrase
MADRPLPGSPDDHSAATGADLGIWRTPLEPADRLGAALGLGPGDLWVKRDDWLGLGGGGNKLRKLAPLCAAARAGGATTLITSGAAQSNYARLTAAAARRLGLEVTLVLSIGDHVAGTGNLALDGLFGADIVWARGDPSALDEAVEQAASDVRARGGTPAVLPFGGSDAIGAAGYQTCARELLEDATGLVHVVTPVGSGGTMAGLVAGLGPERVLGGHAGAVPDPHKRVAKLAAELLERPVAPGRLRIDLDVAGDGYEKPTDASRRAMDLAARHEGIVLDPVYGAKAMVALIGAVQRGEIVAGERTAFVLTGGLPGLFGHAMATELAERTAPPRPPA